MASIEDFELPRSTPKEDAKSERLLERLAEPEENSGARITLLPYCLGMLKAIITPMIIPATAKRDKNCHCFNTSTHNLIISISLVFFSSILIYFFNRLAMVANMVPREAALVPTLSHSVRPIPRRCRLVGTTIWHPGRGLCLRSARATIPFI